jgi:cytochrome d ubiquinol oxidase subunit II
MDIHLIWALIIVFSVLMYTIFDGFDLGIGMALLFFNREADRDTIVDTISPVWDGNESWIVLAGVGLFGGFPEAYAVLLPALYIPIIIMVISLALRGVSMEIRFLSARHKKHWDLVFGFGSLMASFCQGLIVGNLIEGIQPRTTALGFQPDAFYFVTPFTFCSGILVVLLYTLIGLNWLNYKTTGQLQKQVKIISPRILATTFAYMVLYLFSRKYFSVFVPRFSLSGSFHWSAALTGMVFTLGAGLFVLLYFSLKSKRDSLPFFINIALFIFLALFVVGHLWPNIVPPFVSLYHTGAPQYGNKVLLYAALIVIPIILSYLLYAYFVFKGKAKSNPDYEARITDKTAGRVKISTGTEQTINLSLACRIALKLVWIVLFFIILGFLGDLAALGTIAVFILIFCTAWYKNSLRQAQPDDQI